MINFIPFGQFEHHPSFEVVEERGILDQQEAEMHIAFLGIE